MYRLVQEGQVIDVLDKLVFVRKQLNGVVILSDEKSADGVVSSDGERFYSVGLHEVYGPLTTIEEISEEEYRIYKERLKSDKVSSDEQVLVRYNEDSIEFIRQQKVLEMRAYCKKAITNGVDVMLNGVKKHFSLSLEDQVNILTLKLEVGVGETGIYHADGNICEEFSYEDINRIYDISKKWKEYNTTYYNALRFYILSLDSLDSIKSVHYGMEIPVEYKTAALVELEEIMSKL